MNIQEKREKIRAIKEREAITYKEMTEVAGVNYSSFIQAMGSKRVAKNSLVLDLVIKCYDY
jgi:hypothetical protein